MCNIRSGLDFLRTAWGCAASAALMVALVSSTSACGESAGQRGDGIAGSSGGQLSDGSILTTGGGGTLTVVSCAANNPCAPSGTTCVNGQCMPVSVDKSTTNPNCHPDTHCRPDAPTIPPPPPRFCR